jgi:pilus assembly protein FimV
MTPIRRPRPVHLLTGLLLAGLLPSASALSLGLLQGSAVIGRPLALAVQIQAEAGEDLAALCLEAEVYHADTRQDPRSVRIQTDTAQPALVRISSASRVDEPVVTLLLRAGCAQKTTRRYVLLADPPAEPLAPGAVAVIPLPQTAEVAAPTPAASAAVPSAPEAPASAPAATQGGRPAALAPVRTAVAPERIGSAVSPAGGSLRPATSGPRLTLSPPRPPASPTSSPGISPSAPALATPPLAATSAADAAAAAQALAEEKIRQLERDMKAAQALAARQEAGLLALQTRLNKAEAERFPVEVLYALVALVLACLTVVGWLWSRLRRLQADSGEWWSNSVMTQPAAFANSDVASPVTAASLAQNLSGHSTRAGAVSELAPSALPSGVPPTADFQATDLTNLVDFDLNQSRQAPDQAR